MVPRQRHPTCPRRPNGRTAVSQDVLAGRYRLGRVLGRGGMGTVYAAHDEVLGRDVAVKVLDLTASDATAMARFTREARALASVQHPHIVAVHDFGTDASTAWLVMPLLPGPDLQTLINQQGPLPLEAVTRYGGQAATALSAAHAAGIVHRDVKPANLMLAADGSVILLDLGIARLADATAQAGGHGPLTKTGHILGSVPYLAPEVISGEPPGPPADVYALGAVLFGLLTGRTRSRTTAWPGWPSTCTRRRRRRRPAPRHTGRAGAAPAPNARQEPLRPPDRRRRRGHPRRAGRRGGPHRRLRPRHRRAPRRGQSAYPPAARPSPHRPAGSGASAAPPSALAVAGPRRCPRAAGVRRGRPHPTGWAGPGSAAPSAPTSPTASTSTPPPPPPTPAAETPTPTVASDPVQAALADLQAAIDAAAGSGELVEKEASDTYQRLDKLRQALQEDQDDAEKKIDEFGERMDKLGDRGDLSEQAAATIKDALDTLNDAVKQAFGGND